MDLALEAWLKIVWALNLLWEELGSLSPGLRDWLAAQWAQRPALVIAGAVLPVLLVLFFITRKRKRKKAEKTPEEPVKESPPAFMPRLYWAPPPGKAAPLLLLDYEVRLHLILDGFRPVEDLQAQCGFLRGKKARAEAADAVAQYAQGLEVLKAGGRELSLDLWQQAAAKAALSSLHLGIGRLHMELGHTKRAVLAADRSMKLADLLPADQSREAMARALELKAAALFLAGDLNGGVEPCEKALALWRGLGDQSSLAGAQGLLGCLQAARGRLMASAAAFEQGLETLSGMDDPKTALMKAALTASLGEVRRALGRKEESFDLLRKALSFYRDLDDEGPRRYDCHRASAFIGLGLTRQPAQAEEIFKRAAVGLMKLVEQTGGDASPALSGLLALAYNSLGENYHAMEQLNPAGEACKKALDLYQELSRDMPLSFLPGVARSAGNLAYICRDLGRTGDSFDYSATATRAESLYGEIYARVQDGTALEEAFEQAREVVARAEAQVRGEAVGKE